MRFERLILTLGTLAVGCVGSAAMALDPLDAIGVCSRISKKDARLECYDQVARDSASGRLQSSAPASQQGWAAPVGGAQTPAPQSAQAPAASGFGAEALPRTQAERRETSGPDSLEAQVASSTDNGLGQWRIRLADGAVWQMTERVSMFRPPAPNETVTIRKGALGSYLMDVGKQGSVRVTRVR
ncbi:MAG TPA: hypothetical protein VFF89_02505 [Sphingobium sp.]|nr:hypothetical protein [Sphingobium sp.]